MKYTRYDINKRKSNGLTFLIFITGIILASLLLGTILAKITMPDSNIIGDEGDISIIDTDNTPETDQSDTSDSGQPVIKPIDDGSEGSSSDNPAIVDNKGVFAILQCGAFSSEENAMNLKADLEGFGKPFVVKSGEINKVVLGVYNDNNIESIKTKLDKVNIEFSINHVTLSTEDKCDNQISLILEGSLNIISEIEQGGANSVKTESIKKWLKTLAEIDSSGVNYNSLVQLKEYTAKLPDEISKENLTEIKEYYYNFLLKFDETL